MGQMWKYPNFWQFFLYPTTYKMNQKTKIFYKSATMIVIAIKIFQLKLRLPRDIFINFESLEIFVLFVANNSKEYGCIFSEFLGGRMHGTSDPEYTKMFK